MEQLVPPGPQRPLGLPEGAPEVLGICAGRRGNNEPATCGKTAPRATFIREMSKGAARAGACEHGSSRFAGSANTVSGALPCGRAPQARWGRWTRSSTDSGATESSPGGVP